jgi:hypothetical protein
MPTKQEYQRIVEDKQSCSKCGRHLDDKDFVTCSICRRGKLNESEDKELRRSAMSLFGIGMKSNSAETLAERLQREILPNITSSGTVTKTINHIIGGNLSQILDFGSGSVRLQRNVIKKFNLEIGQPTGLKHLNPFQIRCSLCRSVISYPAWYYSIKYAVNHFHYFVCFDSASSSKPSTKCYRRVE